MLHRLTAVATVILWALGLPAQSTNATITGRVADQTKAAIVGASVLVSNMDTGVRNSVTTNQQGLFYATQLPPGTYRVEVEKQGFRSVITSDVVLHVQDVITLNFNMVIGAASETITVLGAPLVDTESANVSTVVDRRFVEDMPLNGRSFQSLFELTPGVVLTPTQEFGEHGQFAVNGNRADSNYFSIDGVSANFAITPAPELGQDASGALPALSALGGTNNLVSIDALQEFRIETSSFAPEFGRGGAQVVLATRSGTNQFHGTAFDYLRNDVFDANDWFANNKGLPKAKERQNDFGGVFGGPIIKGKTFFFFSYEGLRLRQPKTAITDVPSLFARQNAVAAAQPYLNWFPLPNGPATIVDTKTGNVLANEFNATFSDPATLDAYSIRGDQAIGSKVTLFGRFNYSPSKTDTRNTGRVQALSDHGTTELTTQTTTIGMTALLTPRLTNDFRFNYSTNSGSTLFYTDNFGGAVRPPDSVLFPPGFGTNQDSDSAVIIFGLRGFAIHTGVSAHNNRQHQLNFVDNVSFARGKHQGKLGFDFRRLTPITGNRKHFILPFFFTMQDAMNGVANQVLLENNQIQPQLLFHNYSAYAQDTWKAKNRLTLTYGIRWEHNPPPSELTGNPPFAVDQISDLATMKLQPRGTELWKSSRANFAPRFGANYLLRESADWPLVLRGGFGIFYALGTETAGSVAQFSHFPYSASSFPKTVPLPLTVSPPDFNSIFTPPFGWIAIFDPHLKVPYTQQWNLGIEQGLGADQQLTATYTGSVGRRLLRQNILNSQFLSVNPDFTFPVLTNNADHSNYNALQLQYQRRLSHGLQVLASYTLAHSLDNGSSDGTFGRGYNTAQDWDASGQFPSTFYDVNQDYGSSDYDIRHAFTAAVTYEVPGGHLSNSILHHVAGGWSVDGILHARSAPPLAVIYMPRVTKFTYEFGSLDFRADIVPGQPFYISNPTAPGGRELNPAAFLIPTFATPAESRQGTLGRNALRAFDLVQADLSLGRVFTLHERLRLLFRADAFNIFNHPNFGYPQQDLSVGGFGQPFLTLSQTLGSGNGFGGGFNPLYATGGPRSMQLSLKLQF